MKNDGKTTLDYGRLLQDIDKSATETSSLKATHDHQHGEHD